MAQWANMLAELQCGPGWLARHREFDSRCCRNVETVSACYEIKFLGRYRGFDCILLNCDRPSHPDWGHLGVMRAAGVDNR